MSQAPAMPVFTDALIGDTTHLDTEEFGAYFLILCATWRNNGMPLIDDDARLARICRVGAGRWRTKLRPILMAFFDISSGNWVQKKLEKQWGFATKNREQQREKGKRSAAVKLLKINESASTAVATEPSTEYPSSGCNTAPTSITITNTKEERKDKNHRPNLTDDENATFEQWWAFYPEKVSKGQARAAWPKALAKATMVELLAGVNRYVQSKPPDQRYCHPATWLNAERWLDESAPPPTAKPTNDLWPDRVPYDPKTDPNYRYMELGL